MLQYILLAVLLILGGPDFGVYAQDNAVTPKSAQELAAALDKTKYKKKEKRDVVVEFYIDIKNRPAERKSIAEFAGLYVCDTGVNTLELKVSADGAATGTGVDMDPNDDRPLNFRLRDARVDGAVLRATKVYENGGVEPLEAVFVDRTTSTGKNPQTIESTETEFGVGYIRSDGRWTSRVFVGLVR